MPDVVTQQAEFATATGAIYYEIISPAEVTTALPTLILLHNFMSTGRSAWGPMVEKLAENYRLLLPDLPGHGRSLGYPPGYNYAQMAEQLAALLAHEDATAGHLAGCSAGGMVAQLLVHHGWVTPPTLTLISTTYSISEQVTGSRQALKPENFRAGSRWMAATAKLHDSYRYPGYYEAEMLPAFRQLNPMRGIDLPLSALAAWAMPVCIIHGDADEFFPTSIVTQMAQAIPDATLHLVADQPHALIFRQPWHVLKLMLAFLDAHRAP
jgi:pimeloyl-ACP methyl ester carboxylesterase